jgi:Helix-turn-helix.
MNFSEKVIKVRMKLLLSQEALAKEIGVSYATVCRWEKGNREPQVVSQGKFYAFCDEKGIRFED